MPLRPVRRQYALDVRASSGMPARSPSTAQRRPSSSAQVVRQAVVGEVGQRVAQRRQLPVDDGDDARLGRVEDAGSRRGSRRGRWWSRRPAECARAATPSGDPSPRSRRSSPRCTAGPSARSGGRSSCRPCRSRPAPPRRRPPRAGAPARRPCPRTSRCAPPGATPGRCGWRKTRPSTQPITKNGVPITSLRRRTGAASAAPARRWPRARVITRYSRSTWCADGSSWPGRLLAQHVAPPPSCSR